MDVFMHPWLVAGAALAAIPVILHLIMRQKPRQLEFPALRLLRLRKHSNTRRLQLRHWLLLALRIAAVCFMALGLARPRVQSDRLLIDQEAPVAAAFVFDTSYRMQYRNQNETRLQSVRDTALWLLSELPQDSEIALVKPALSYDNEAPLLSGFQPSLGAAKQQIERLEPTPVSQPITALIEDALEQLRTSKRDRKELYIFTDLSTPAWTTQSYDRLHEALDKAGGAGIYLIDVGVEDPQNFALGDVQLSSQILSKNSPADVSVDVTRWGTSGKRNLEMYMLDATGREQKQGEQEVDLGPKETKQVTFPLPRLDVGIHQGVIRIAGEDPLEHDNTRYFTLAVKPAWKVLVTGPWPRPKGDGFLHPSDFLIEAVAPFELRKKDEARFDCRYVPLDELDKETLANFAVVCVLDPPAMDPIRWSQLRSFAERGGGVAIFLGAGANKTSMNGEEAQALLPGKLDFAGRSREGVYLAPNNVSHPLLAPFRMVEGGVPWNLFPVYQYWKFEDLVEGTRVIIPFNNKLPAMIERSVGKGRSITLVTPVSDLPGPKAWNELARDWPWVMLADEMLLYMAGEREGHFNYQVGETPDVRLEPEEQATQFVVQMPGNEAYRAQVDGDARLISLMPAGRPGNYQMRSSENAADFRGFSANLPRDQSDLSRIEPGILKEVFGKHPHQVARNRSEIERAQSKERIGREVFPILMVLLAIVLAGEFVLATRFYREA